MFTQLLLFAQGTAPGGGGTPPPQDPLGPLGWLLPMLPILVLFYFLMIRPQQRQEAERKALATNLKKNDKVLTAGGIYGTVVSVSDTEDEVVVKVDDNARLRMLKSSVLRNLSAEEAAKAQKDQKKEQKETK